MPHLIPSPYCTIGPFYLKPLIDGCDDLTRVDGQRARGQHILLTGRVVEEGNAPVLNSVLEIWQADANGVLRHPLDAGGIPAYRFDIVLRGENETPFFLD